MDLLSKDQIQMNAEAADWQSAVRIAGRLLVKTGAAEERYVEAMVNLAQELGPYIVVTPGIAVPHARPEEGAKKVGLAAVKLAAPVCFGNADNDPVYLVLGFCTPNAEAHVDLLSNIAMILGTDGVLEKIKAASRAEDIMAVFNQPDETLTDAG